MALQWIGDDGPLVLLAEAQSAGWLGVWREATDEDDDRDVEEIDGRRLVLDDELDDARPRTDYARVCAALEPPAVVALVPFAGGTALALETSGHQAAVVRDAEGVVIAKWVFSPSERVAEEALAAMPRDLAWRSTGVAWRVPPGGGRLHVAAEREGDCDAVHFDVEPGTYAIETSVLEPDDDTSFELWRLRRSG